MPSIDNAWDDRIYAAEFNYCLGLGLMVASDEDMERDLARILLAYPGYFPGPKNEAGLIIYDDSHALAFVMAECPGIPKAYIQDWLQVWDATGTIYSEIQNGEDADVAVKRTTDRPEVALALARRGETVYTIGGSVGAG